MKRKPQSNNKSRSNYRQYLNAHLQQVLKTFVPRSFKALKLSGVESSCSISLCFSSASLSKSIQSNHTILKEMKIFLHVSDFLSNFGIFVSGRPEIIYYTHTQIYSLKLNMFAWFLTFRYAIGKAERPMLKSKIGWLDILANDTHEYYYPNNTGGPSIKVSRFSPNRITEKRIPQTK